MVDLFRKQLDELMGANRDELTEHDSTSFTDPKNCRYFLAGTCPYEVLQKTKAEIGVCKNVHSIPARIAYEEASKKEDYGYEDILERKLRSIIAECDRRIQNAQRRVDETERDKLESNPYEREIKELQKKHESLLEEGSLDEANAVHEELKALRAKRGQARAQLEPTDEAGKIIAQLGGSPQYQVLRACEVCGSLLSAKETKRLEDHFVGKLHMGYAEIREKLTSLEKRDRNRVRAKEYETEIPDLQESYGRGSRPYYERERDYDRDRYRKKERFRSRYEKRDYDDRRYRGDSKDYRSRYDY
ncbi:putative RNA-binding protein Luc7-like 1 [Schistocerca gregaria]|uniref:putative RNA-binding protein Luc7-like 1 n=1 Tax=Schistocerca gregaria TaxID=7010 RepID=UPI00211E5718|nr:putative RNA-binding protein Luc7-like 1 [Schistocerca gregaria]